MRFAVPGVEVGHWTDPVAETGCTVVLLPPGAVASFEARGGAPASRELIALEPDKAISTVDAVVLTGGSAFGLAAADGVMWFCEQSGRGVPTPGGRVPIVPALALFDLAVGAPARPGAEQGQLAAADATGDAVLSGRVGAGAGAYVGHWRGPSGRRPGGLGYAAAHLGDLAVGVLVAVNAFGDVDDGRGPVAVDAVRELPAGFGDLDAGGRTHTTIGVVVTNARLDKAACRIVAQGAHDGLSRAITPPHTRYDGDAFVAAATGIVEAAVDAVRLLALAATVDAIRSVAAPAG